MESIIISVLFLSLWAVALIVVLVSCEQAVEVGDEQYRNLNGGENNDRAN